jgi:hypothetical protein
MKRRNLHIIAAIPPAIYAILLFIAFVPVFVTNEELAGVGVVLLTLPWSFLMVGFVDHFDLGLFESLPGVVFSSFICGGMNALILYALTYWVMRPPREESIEHAGGG